MKGSLEVDHEAEQAVGADRPSASLLKDQDPRRPLNRSVRRLSGDNACLMLMTMFDRDVPLSRVCVTWATARQS